MWNITKVELSNFFSHHHSVYELKNNTCTLIIGENRDAGGNNGAGKSSVFEAIAVALTNRSLRDLKKESFINYDADSCRITLWLDNPVTRHTLSITRQFFRGNKSAKVELVEDGKVNSAIVSVDEANKRVLDLIGISREDLLRYFIISQDNNYTFFTAGDVEKKEVLNRITSADMINPVLEKLSESKKAKQGEIDALGFALTAIDAKIETLTEQRQELIDADDTAEEMRVLKEKNAYLEREIKRIEDTKQANLERLKEVEAKASKLNTPPDVSALKEKRKKRRAEIDKCNDEIAENKNILRMAREDIEGAITCPKCGSEFMKESNLQLSPKDTRDIIKQSEEAIKSQKKHIEKLENEVSELGVQISEADSLSEEIELRASQIKSLGRKIKDADDEVNDVRAKVIKNNEAIAKLRERKHNDTAIKAIDDKIKACNDERGKVSDKQRELNADMEMIAYWLYYMGKAGFQTYLANKSLSIIEGGVNSFLRKFRTDLSVSINGFKILRDGSVREKIEVFALSNGLDAEAFMSKSGGERGRINLAGVLAIQHLINMSCNGGGLNFLALDESFHGVDSNGQENMIKILEHLNTTIMMITQNVSSEFNSENKLLIVKENGVSRFSQS